MSKVPRWCAAILLWAMIYAQAACATKPSHKRSTFKKNHSFLSYFVNLKDWKIQDPTKITGGQFGILQEKKRNKLLLYRLNKTYLKPVPQKWKFAKTRVPKFHGNCYLISDFEGENQNRLGGHFNHFKKSPSNASTALKQGKDGRFAFSLNFKRAQKGFCGAWIHLFATKVTFWKRFYLDTKPFGYLSFWVRASKGNPKVRIKLSDVYWELKGDGLPVGMLHDFLPGKRLTHKWKRAIIPLKKLPKRLDKRRLVSLVFEVLKGQGQLDIKTLAICIKPTPMPPLPKPLPKAVQKRKLLKATWVWNTKQILKDKREEKRLMTFLLREKFNHVFLQIPEIKGKKRVTPDALVTFEAPLQKLIAKLNKHNIKVHALDGYKNYALPSWHKGVLDVIKAIVAYNKRSKPEQRFYGIHYDIEPYLLGGYWGPKQAWIQTNYLKIIEEITKLAHAAKPRMVSGVDIPFWFDALNPTTQQVPTLMYKNKRKPMHEHVIDLVDNIGIMDYRTTVYGADGILTHARSELHYAARAGKKVYIALETHDLPDEHLFFFKGYPKKGFPKKKEASYIFYMLPHSSTHREMVFLSFSQLPLWKTYIASRKISPDSLLYWTTNQKVFVPATKLSYARLGNTYFQRSLKRAHQALIKFPAFVGFALHHYQSLMDILPGYKNLPASKNTKPSQKPPSR